MASKKAASKVRKAAKPAPSRASAHGPARHRTEARSAPASTHRVKAPTKKGAVAKPTVHKASAVKPSLPPKPTPLVKPTPATKQFAAVKPISAVKPIAVAKPVTVVKPSSVAAAAPPPEADEGEGAESNSLLAGPRNVKPYIAKRGELYMGKLQLGHFQEILTHWKRDLMLEVDRTVTHMKDEASNFPDPNDRATQEEEFSLELRTRDRERKLIRKIEEALKRLEDGNYGYCLETGEEIGIKRLEARPVATLSLEAQERRERRERQYGDRDDRYR